jgi:hypothetical protein
MSSRSSSIASSGSSRPGHSAGPQNLDGDDRSVTSNSDDNSEHSSASHGANDNSCEDDETVGDFDELAGEVEGMKEGFITPEDELFTSTMLNPDEPLEIDTVSSSNDSLI